MLGDSIVCVDDAASLQATDLVSSMVALRLPDYFTSNTSRRLHAGPDFVAGLSIDLESRDAELWSDNFLLKAQLGVLPSPRLGGEQIYALPQRLMEPIIFQVAL